MFYKVSRIVALAIFAALIIIPSAIVVLGSTKTDAEVYNKPLALPERWTLDNFRFLFEVSNVGKSFLNSIIVTGFSVTITLILASMCAFAISRMITVTGKVLFSLFAVGLAIPGQVNLVPIFILFNDLQLTNKLSGLILINVVTTLPISVFILTAFFRELPKEMYEVSEVDGATPLRVYRSIALPLSRPAMGATAIFLFVITWNELLFPLLLITDVEKRTLPLSLLSFRGEFFSNYSMIFTAVMVASIPMVAMYLLMQRSFIAGLLKHAPEITAITNQWVNSYKRLHGGGEAPAFVNWGPSDRGALVRVPMYKPKKENSTRIEFRSPDTACNPYLAYAVMLAAGLKGVEEGYVLKDSRDPISLPSDLNEAIEEMEKSELVRQTLGEHVFEYVLRNKRAEWHDYRRQVSAYELDRYLPVL